MLTMESAKTAGQTINIGTGVQASSLLDLAQMVKKIVDDKKSFNYLLNEILGDIKNGLATTPRSSLMDLFSTISLNASLKVCKLALKPILD
jgi:nucleoside-diphosphate-sugar epimerase